MTKPSTEKPILLQDPRESKNPLNRIILNALKEKGVFVLTAPTGSGKTYSVQSVCVYLVKDANLRKELWPNDRERQACLKVFIISPRIANLNDYEKVFKANGIQCYFARSTTDTIKELHEKYKDKLKNKIVQPNLKNSENLNKFISYISIKEYDEAAKAYANFLKEVKRHLQKEEEEAYPREIEDIIKEKQYQWLKEFFPDMEGIKSPIVLMSSRKELIGRIYSPIKVSDSTMWCTHIQNGKGVVIRDESDSIKADQKNGIIEESLKNNRADIRGATHQLTDRIIQTFKDRKHSLYKELEAACGDKAETIAAELVKKAEEIKTRYAIGLPFRINDPKIRPNEILFYKSGTTTKNIKEKTYIQKTESTNLLTTNCNEDEHYMQRLDALPNDFHSLCKQFAGILRKLAGARKKSLENTHPCTDEEAFRKVLSDMDITPSKTRELYDCLYAAYMNPSRLKIDKEKEEENDAAKQFYKNGIQTVFVACEYEENVEIKENNIETTPEAILLANRNNTQILISATADAKSITNYNLDYIKEELGENFRTINEEDIKEVKEYLQYQELEKEVRYNVIPMRRHEGAQNNFEDCSFFNNDEAGETWIRNKINGRLNSVTTNEFIRSRYEFFLKSYVEARRNGSDAIIMFGPKALSKEGDYNTETMKALLQEINESVFDGRELFFAVYSRKESEDENSHKDFDFIMKKAAQSYAKGNIVLIYTTYQTASTGLNFEIPIRESDKNLFHYSIPGRSSNGKKDFNGLIFELPTNTHVAAL